MKGWNNVIGLLCLWLTACNPHNELERHFQTYLARVANVLEVSPPSLPAPAPLPPLPPQRRLQQQQQRVTAGLLDTLKLGECRLLGLVGEHNSPVGKSQSAAAILLYHLQFQQGLRDCLVRAEDPSLQDWLTEVESLKAPLLPGYHWNMMVAEPEIRAALMPRARALRFAEQGGYQETVAAFALFDRLYRQARGLAEPVPLTGRELNHALSGLYDNDYLGQLFYSLHSAAHYLEQSIDFLRQLEQFDCGPRGREQAERLRNAMQHYYIRGIQAYFSRLDRQFVQLAPLLERTLSPPMPSNDRLADYRRHFARGLDSLVYTRYREQALAHARLWQRFLARCDISPT
ncbi:DUF3080 family protein [Zobellella sp. An-6]|uniref:DUF3080 family protein n=1 Tax=Zobellella sp. An-6 TaxID=3400218 RepID=UPI0040431CD8